ncbi:hypothetical protein TNCV_3746041 [Trichonephila clavipes]|nr:hypothetical protein TNCV_3746041 [Trichonephila clavipes]
MSPLVGTFPESQSSPGISVSSRTIGRKTWVTMVVQPLTSQTSLYRMRSIDCNGVELTVIVLWTCGKTIIWSLISLYSLAVGWTCLGLADDQRTFL